MADMSEQEAEELLRGFAEAKTTLPGFFKDVVKSEDTTKTGNLTADELGMPKLPVRTYQELSLFSKEVADMPYFAEYFKKMAEIQLGTSLSRDAMLLKLAVTQKKELADMTPVRKENKGWFKSKEPIQTTQ